ncbi:MAG: cupin domain-containing protein [Polyangiaceae bacterium]|nr:cupin domain-containing protein [Polyangiaceae bacterium]
MSLTRLAQAAGARDLNHFLEEIWQRSPRCLRGVSQDFSEVIGPEALFELAADPAVESRLVVEGEDGHLRLTRGPIDAARRRELPPRGWTLLVQDVDKHLRAASELLRPFSALPRWRLDDLMISYAVPGGSVGPHTDSYDVFLFQALGARRWELASAPGSGRCERCELTVLSDFQAEQRFDLAPGDCLYLPPGVAHHGVALEPCMTFSVGFRAASVEELLSALLGDLCASWLARAAESAAYRDAERALPAHPGELGSAARRHYALELERLLSGAPEALRGMVDRALLRQLTEPKETQPLPEPGERAPLLPALAAGRRLCQHHATRWLFLSEAGDVERVWLAVDGELTELSPSDRRFAALLCDAPELPSAELLEQLRDPERGVARLALVEAWLESGQLTWC